MVQVSGCSSEEQHLCTNATISRYVWSTPVRLAKALERMEAATETIVDPDDQAHLAAVR